MAEYELSLDRGTHRLIDGDYYEPVSSSGVDGTSDSPLPEFEREERRQRMLAAALNRLRTEEEELEQSCGTSGPAKITPPVSTLSYFWKGPQLNYECCRRTDPPFISFSRRQVHYLIICTRVYTALINPALYSTLPPTRILQPAACGISSTTTAAPVVFHARICPCTIEIHPLLRP